MGISSKGGKAMNAITLVDDELNPINVLQLATCYTSGHAEVSILIHKFMSRVVR